MESSWVTGDNRSFIQVAVLFHKGAGYLVSKLNPPAFKQLFLLLKGNMTLPKAFYYAFNEVPLTAAELGKGTILDRVVCSILHNYTYLFVLLKLTWYPGMVGGL